MNEFSYQALHCANLPNAQFKAGQHIQQINKLVININSIAKLKILKNIMWLNL